MRKINYNVFKNTQKDPKNKKMKNKSFLSTSRKGLAHLPLVVRLETKTSRETSQQQCAKRARNTTKKI